MNSTKLPFSKNVKFVSHIFNFMIKGETLWAQTKGKLYASEGFEDGSMEERSSFLGLNQTKREVKRMFKFVCELLQLAPCNVLSQIFSFFQLNLLLIRLHPFQIQLKIARLKQFKKWQLSNRGVLNYSQYICGLWQYFYKFGNIWEFLSYWGWFGANQLELANRAH